MKSLNLSLIFKSIGKISIDNNFRFGYQDGCSGLLIGVLICGAKSETGTQCTFFWLMGFEKSTSYLWA